MRKLRQTVFRQLPTHFERRGTRLREGPDCSCGCRRPLELPDGLGEDSGPCILPRSPRLGGHRFEHRGCEFIDEEA